MRLVGVGMSERVMVWFVSLFQEQKRRKVKGVRGERVG